MNRISSTREVPDDEAHWDRLAQRVAAEAARSSVAAGAGALGWLSGARALVVAASIVLAVALTLLALPSGQTSAGLRSKLEAALAPTSDPIGDALVRGSEPPSVAGLLVGSR